MLTKVLQNYFKDEKNKKNFEKSIVDFFGGRQNFVYID